MNDLVGYNVDWSPSGRYVAVVLGKPVGSSGSATDFRVARLSYPDLDLHQFDAHNSDEGPIAVDDSGAVYWQRFGSSSTELVRTSTDGGTTVWEIEGLPFVDLEYGSRGLIAARVREVGQEHDDVEIVGLDTSGSTLVGHPIESVPGLTSIAVGEDGVSIAHGSQSRAGAPATITVTGPVGWSTTLTDVDTLPIGLGSSTDRVYVRLRSNSHLGALGRESLSTTTDLQVEVFAFDVSVRNTVAYSNPNFTGGPGRVCFLEHSGDAPAPT